jgi:hypothetical protein
VSGDIVSTYIFGILLQAILRIDFKYNLDYPFVDDGVWAQNSHFVVTIKLGIKLTECRTVRLIT